MAHRSISESPTLNGIRFKIAAEAEEHRHVLFVLFGRGICNVIAPGKTRSRQITPCAASEKLCPLTL
jgi:hypothetical protein